MLPTTPAAANETVVQQITLRRQGRSAEVASAYVFLTSNEASFVIGQVLDVARGWPMT